MKRFLLFAFAPPVITGRSAGDAAKQYTSESGQLLRDESRPFLSIAFREPA